MVDIFLCPIVILENGLAWKIGLILLYWIKLNFIE